MYSQAEIDHLRKCYFNLLSKPFAEPEQWGEVLRTAIYKGGLYASTVADEFNCSPKTVLQWALNKKTLSIREVHKRQRKLAGLILIEMSKSQKWVH